MHWKSWKALGKPKCIGGLGFRHLETFNKALLAKQIWRVLQSPESLVARVLKARYYKHQDIMHASLGSNPSYIWRSLLWSRPLLEKGLYWPVRNGERIDTFASRWIPGRGVQPKPPQFSGTYDKVSSLILNGQWNEQIVLDSFPPHVAAEVLDIPIYQSNHEDFIYWAYDPKGRYSVREGYKREIGFYEPPDRSSELHSKKWWKFIWAMSVPPKVRVFWWRILHNIIPTSVNLMAPHVPVTGSCPLCHFGYDNTTHALFSCSVVKGCWKTSRFWDLLKQVQFLEVFDIFCWMKDKLSQMDFELFAINTYAMWRERLNLVHNQGTLGKGFNVNWSDTLLREFQEAQRLRLLNGKMDNSGNSQKTWTAPQINELRMDVDAAFNENLNSFAVGGVVRNHEGQPLIAFGTKIRKPSSIVYGELAAIDIGMKIAKDHNLFINQITSDSLLAMQTVTHIDEDLSYVGTYAQFIRRSLSEHNGATLKHIRRTANAVADSLAAFAISHPTSFVWKPGDFPYWFVKLVTRDISQSQ